MKMSPCNYQAKQMFHRFRLLKNSICSSMLQTARLRMKASAELGGAPESNRLKLISEIETNVWTSAYGGNMEAPNEEMSFR